MSEIKQAFVAWLLVTRNVVATLAVRLVVLPALRLFIWFTK